MNYTAAVIVMMLLGTGCQTFYTTAVHTSLKNAKIQSSTFAVCPVIDMDYKPASTCFFIPPSTDAGSNYQAKLNSTIVKELPKKFPNQRLVFLGEKDSFFITKGHEMEYILSLAEDYVSIVAKIKRSSSDSTFYADLPVNNKIGAVLSDLRAVNGADYAILFMKPHFSGETTYSYSAPMYNGVGGWTGGGGSSQTTYTADIQIQVWDCRNGQMIYESGIITSGSNYCFFISPQDAAIQSVPNDVMKKLTKIITCILERQPSRFAAQ